MGFKKLKIETNHEKIKYIFKVFTSLRLSPAKSRNHKIKLDQYNIIKNWHNTKKLSKYHSLVKRIQGEYNRFHALRSGLDRELLLIDLPKSSVEKQIVMNHWGNLGGDLMGSIYNYIENIEE